MNTLTKLILGGLILSLSNNLFYVQASEGIWKKSFDNKYIVSIENTPWGIMAGEKDTRTWNSPFNGIYLSKDLGDTWNEFGLFERGITDIKYFDETIYAATYYDVDEIAGLFKSQDMGDWEHIGPNYSASCINADSQTIYLGTYDHGLWVSFDKGNSWEEKISDVNILKIDSSEDETIVYTKDKIYKSDDHGDTFKEESSSFDYSLLSSKSIVVYTYPQLIFKLNTDDGIYKKEIEEKIPINQFLNIPWKTNKPNDLLEKITSYFDHSYPLLSYWYHGEPEDEADTTLNFYGIKEKEPFMYYSSHDGVDFALNYGTKIIAPASGYAKYFNCSPCGNAIKIDHQNGYQTTYMHLQAEDLITVYDTVWVEPGDVLGRVGMTGNTTGPHLHFSVTKDVNNNGNFLDDSPGGKVDPYGWLPKDSSMKDPWKYYGWKDWFGEYSGTESVYLWNYFIPESIKFLTTSDSVTTDNKKVSLEDVTDKNITVYLKSYLKPKAPLNLKYIENTSFIINAVTQVGVDLINLDNPAELSVDIKNLDLSKVLKETLKIYAYNSTQATWEALPTILDLSDSVITAYTTHFSQFAVFGEIDMQQVPKSRIEVKDSIFSVSSAL